MSWRKQTVMQERSMDRNRFRDWFGPAFLLHYQRSRVAVEYYMAAFLLTLRQ